MDQKTKETINNEIDSNDVCLFMKGTPEAPQCGFSTVSYTHLTLPTILLV